MKPRTLADKARRRRRRRWIWLTVCLLLVVPMVSYVRALLYPGNASFAVRTVEWIRDHGAGGVIDTIETWKYSRQAPPASGQPQDMPATALASGRPATGLPAIRALPGVKALQHEGAWSLASQGSGGRPLLWTTWFRPDAAHLPVIAAAALIPPGVDKVRLMPGTREPVVGTSSKDGYSVPIRVGAWNKTVRMDPDVVAVRQNLDPVIVGGRIVAGLADNANGRWGSVRSQFQYTWRSGLGTDANGNLIYVAGQGLTLATLAAAMHQAGIQEGMELDIHAVMVSFDIEHAQGGAMSSKRLIDSMTSPTDRDLVDDQRDFFYVVAR